MALITYPLNNVEYTAEDAELFHVTRTSGIYAGNSFECFVSGDDNIIVINPGIGWIKNHEFAGKVIAQKTSVSIDMGVPDANYPRIDAVVIQFDANANATNIVVKNGVAASNPIAPEVVRTGSIYELHLYHVRRNAGELTISQSNITDLRLNSEYCGLMANSITQIDTSLIETQINTLITRLENEIDNVIDGTAFLMRDGSNSMNGVLDMGANRISNVGEPVNDNDVVSKNYVNENFVQLGYGYGEPMEQFYSNNDSDGSLLHEWLDDILETIENGMSKQIRIADYPYTSGATMYGSIFRHTNDYATVVMFGYSKEAFLIKQKAGAWESWAKGLFAGYFSYSNGTLTITTI